MACIITVLEAGITSSRSSDFHNSLLSAMLIAEMIITLLISDDVSVTSRNLSEMEPLFETMDLFL